MDSLSFATKEFYVIWHIIVLSGEVFNTEP